MTILNSPTGHFKEKWQTEWMYTLSDCSVVLLWFGEDEHAEVSTIRPYLSSTSFLSLPHPSLPPAWCYSTYNLSDGGCCQGFVHLVWWCWVSSPQCDSPTLGFGWWLWAMCSGEQEQLWSNVAVTMTKEQKRGENRGVRSICGNVLIAETANTDKEMSLRDALLLPIYPHGLLGFWLLPLWACLWMIRSCWL